MAPCKELMGGQEDSTKASPTSASEEPTIESIVYDEKPHIQSQLGFQQDPFDLQSELYCSQFAKIEHGLPKLEHALNLQDQVAPEFVKKVNRMLAEPKKQKYCYEIVDDIYVVDEFDSRMFLTAYHEAVKEAVKKFKEHHIPFMTINFEYLTLCIFREKLGFEFENEFKELLAKKVKPRINDIFEEEENLDSKIDEQTFKLIYSREKPRRESDERMSDGDLDLNRISGMSLQSTEDSHRMADESSVYLCASLNKRADFRVSSLWVYESLLRTLKKTFT